jgi:hypothetical protein
MFNVACVFGNSGRRCGSCLWRDVPTGAPSVRDAGSTAACPVVIISSSKNRPREVAGVSLQGRQPGGPDGRGAS